mmetsp:Transcript_50448/g.51337  ORF Transcript_50448/g.51337 Transcript_50448/m.51337 type:complete len:84 (-) Transcript_50448:108-359(-)
MHYWNDMIGTQKYQNAGTAKVGGEVGSFVGRRVGLVVGNAVGGRVGGFVGFRVGRGVGRFVGRAYRMKKKDNPDCESTKQRQQ